MEYIILGIIVNILLLVFAFFIIFKNIKQSKLNKLLKNYKINKKMVVIKKSKLNKWNYRLAYCASFTLIFNIVNFSINGKEMMIGLNDNAVSSSISQDYNHGSSLGTTKPESSENIKTSSNNADYCEYDDENDEYIEDSNCVIPPTSSLTTSEERE